MNAQRLAAFSKTGPPHRQMVILGAGPIGLLASLQARRLGLEVDVWADRFPSPSDTPRLEAIPAQIIGLLVDFGIHPKAFGVTRLVEKRFTQWRSHELMVATAPPLAHVSRPALEISLLRQAEREGVQLSSWKGERWTDALAQRSGDVTVLDTTGRSAVTAMQINKPTQPLVTRTFVQSASPLIGQFMHGGDCFAIAAGPDGYAYRLSNAQQVALGVVGHGGLLRGGACTVFAKIREFAPWLIEGMDPEACSSGSAGAASAQWCSSSHEGAQPVGDALFARDALASQGLAIGFSDALRVVSTLASGEHPEPDILRTQVALHCRRVDALIAESTFASSPAWRKYREFLCSNFTAD